MQIECEKWACALNIFSKYIKLKMSKCKSMYCLIAFSHLNRWHDVVRNLFCQSDTDKAFTKETTRAVLSTFFIQHNQPPASYC